MKHSQCKRCKDLLFDFTSGLTEENQSLWVKKHLKECSACHKEYEEVLQMIHVLKSVEEPELPSGFQLMLHQKLVEATNEKKKVPFLDLLRDFVIAGRWKAVAPALVCLALVIGVFGSGLYDDWKNADAVLVGEKSTATTTAESTHHDNTPSAAPVLEPTVTPAPMIESKTKDGGNTESKKPAQTATTPQKKAEQANFPAVSAAPEVQEKTESSVIEEETNPNAGIAVASEAMETSYGLRASGGATADDQSTVLEEDMQQEEGLREENEVTENDNAAGETVETVAMSSYRISVGQSVTEYLEACHEATGIDWSSKADSLHEDRALLILSDSEWKIFFAYINSTGVLPQTVHAGDVGVAVIIQR